jgi:hypothetical protein
MQTIKLLAFTGITTDLEGLPIITKQANALAAVTASACCRGANRGDKAFLW